IRSARERRDRDFLELAHVEDDGPLAALEPLVQFLRENFTDSHFLIFHYFHIIDRLASRFMIAILGWAPPPCQCSMVSGPRSLRVRPESSELDDRAHATD